MVFGRVGGEHRRMLTTDLNTITKGRVVGPQDHDWDAARQAFNVTLDVRPAAVAFPVDALDVMAIVRYAGAHGMRIAPQATGHNAGPLVDIEDTILVNVREMQEVSIDPAALRVRVGAGVKWERVSPLLSEQGLAGLHGSSPDVGIAGYSLGGGMGWLARKYGLQTNSVTAMELVTADGRFVRTDAEHEPELFWALRGGGGNFGVVTAIEFAVYPVEELYAGAMFFPFERAGEVLHAWRELLPAQPEEMMTWANILHFPPAPFVPEFARGRSFAVVMAAFLGREEEGRELLRGVRDLGPEIDTFAMVPPIELGDLAMDPPDPLPIASTTRQLSGLPAEAVDAMLEVVGPGAPAGTSVALFQLRHMGGALARKAPGAGARATLPGEIALFALGVPVDEDSGGVIRAALNALHTSTAPYDAGYYPNFVEEPADARGFFDDETWARMQRVKALHDPGDMFRGNHHVPADASERRAA
jgi:FAD binding domain-containing protein